MITAWLLALTMQPGRRYDGWRWKRIARYVRKRAGYRCERCHCRARLDVHHRRHVADGGGYWPWNLIALCPACHEKIHGRDLNHDGKVGY